MYLKSRGRRIRVLLLDVDKEIALDEKTQGAGVIVVDEDEGRS